MAKTNYRDELKKLADSVRDPFRLRLLIAVTTVVVMYFAVQQPVEARSRILQRESRDLKERSLIAEDVETIGNELKRIDSRLFTGGSGAVTKFLIDLTREHSLTLERIDGQNAVKLGALEGIRVRLSVSGSIELLHAFIELLESHERYIRVESLLLMPADRGRDYPSMQLVVVALGEKP